MSGLCFEDLEIGRAAERTTLVTQALIEAFASVSGDRNPVHLDVDYAQATPFKGVIAHGMLSAALISAILGMDLPGPGAIYLSQSLTFKRPVRPGDEIIAQAEVTALDAEKARATLRTTCTVAGNVVVEGEAVVMVPRKDAAA